MIIGGAVLQVSFSRCASFSADRELGGRVELGRQARQLVGHLGQLGGLTVDLRGQIVALPGQLLGISARRLGLLDLVQHHLALALQLLALLEQRVAPLHQILLGLDRRRIRTTRRAGLAPVVARREAAGEPQRCDDPSDPHTGQFYDSASARAAVLVVECGHDRGDAALP
jgi:hypothetical protein